MTRLDPRRFPWTIPHLLLFSALLAIIYYLVLRWNASGAPRSASTALAQTGALACAFLLPALVVLRLKGRRALELWVPPAELGRDIAAGLVLGMLLAAMNGIAIKLSVVSSVPAPTGALEQIVRESRGLGDVTLVLIGVGFVAPVAEEVFFRGVAYPTLRKVLPALPGMLVTAALFGAAHLDNLRAQTFLLGLVAAILVEYTGSIVPAACAHIGVNCSFVLFLANGAVLAHAVPLWSLVVAFAALNVLLFLLGKPLFGPPDEKRTDPGTT